MKIKICGITNIEDASVAEEYGADALGFVFYRKSKRFVEPQKAREIINNSNEFVIKAGVFVNEQISNVNSISSGVGLNMAQLHGEESMEYISSINCTVIKAFRVSEDFDFSLIMKYSGYPVLLDAFKNNNFGGTGTKFNWSLIPGEIRSRIILAGGIAIEDLEYIFSNVKPGAIDISSSVERYPGKKDHKRLKEFMRLFNNLRKM